MDRIEAHINRLADWFAGREKVVVALSGGVDSCLVTYLARRFLGREGVVAVISNSASLKARDLEVARSFCATHDIVLEEIDAREIEDPNYAANPSNRCYFCKSALYRRIGALLATRYPGHIVLNGNNYSDLGDYRPGLEAAREYRAYSPLAECKLSKADIRTLALHFGLETWDKPASPCLSSRFPYGEHITVEKLRQVEEGEELLYAYGFNDMRLRYVKEGARVEVPAEDLPRLQSLWPRIEPRLRELGFTFCEIDEEGLISGKLNRVLKHGSELSP